MAPTHMKPMLNQCPVEGRLTEFFVPGVRAIGHSVITNNIRTSKIVEIDPATHTVVTASGSVYELADPVLELMTPQVARDLGFL
jgi:hypothetical protein